MAALTRASQEDGAARGMEAFHKQLPLAALRGERVEWNLADPPHRSATRKVPRIGIYEYRKCIFS